MVNEPWTANDPHSEVFQVVTLSPDMFVNPSISAKRILQSRDKERTLSGKVNCSLPFSKHLGSRQVPHSLIWANLLIPTIASPDGRACLAVGCAEGLWIGYRSDSLLELECEVCAPTMYACLLLTHLRHSPTTCIGSQDGDAMCDARRVWNFPRPGK
jgi:hypothetical protein